MVVAVVRSGVASSRGLCRGPVRNIRTCRCVTYLLCFVDKNREEGASIHSFIDESRYLSPCRANNQCWGRFCSGLWESSPLWADASVGRGSFTLLLACPVKSSAMPVISKWVPTCWIKDFFLYEKKIYFVSGLHIFSIRDRQSTSILSVTSYLWRLELVIFFLFKNLFFVK